MCLPRSRGLTAAFALFLLCTPGLLAAADVYLWHGQSGDFNDPVLWNPFGTPGPDDTATVVVLFEDMTITSSGSTVGALNIFGLDSLLRLTSSGNSSVLASERVDIHFDGELVVEGLSIAVQAFDASTNTPILDVDRSDVSFYGTLARLNAPSAFVTLDSEGRLRFLNGSTGNVGTLSKSFSSVIEVEGEGSLLTASEMFASGSISIENGGAVHVVGGNAELADASMTVAGDSSSFTVDGDLKLGPTEIVSSDIEVESGGAIVIGGDLRMSEGSAITFRGMDSRIQTLGRVVSLGTIEVADGAQVHFDQIGVASAVIPGETVDRTAKFNVSGTDSRLEIGEVVLPEGVPWASEIEITDGASLRAPLVQAADFQNLNRTVLRVSGPSSQLIVDETLRIGLPPHGALGPFGGVGEIAGGAHVQTQ